MKPELTGETIATMIVVPLLAAVVILIGVFFFVVWRSLRARDHDDARLALACWILSAVLLVGIGAATWWGMYPWEAEYHHWTPKSGVVDTVDSRIVPGGSDSKSVEQKFVVSFAGEDQQYAVMDTRAAGVKPGDRLTITCVRRWQWSGTPGYDCNFVSLERGR
jgi:heme/copper-type cytochrome/quinol oxidase subunit 2